MMSHVTSFGPNLCLKAVAEGLLVKQDNETKF